MSGENCLREYTKYVLLNVMGMLGLSCYILADTFFIAQGLGSRGLTALNLAIPIYSFIHGTGLMLGMGGGIRYSMSMSQGKTREGCEVFTHTVILGAIFSVIFIALGIFMADTITVWLGADENVFDMCRIYLRMLMVCSPAFLFSEILVCFVRNDGAPQLSMAGMLSGSFSNIILDYIFIFPLHMGIFGAVLATCMAPVINMSVLSRFFLKKRNHFHLVSVGRQRSVVAWIFAGGVPSLVAELSSGIVIIIFNIIMLGLEGNVGVAAYGVIANLSLVVIAVYTGIGQGIQPLLSRYYGGGSQRNIKKVFRYAVLTLIVLSALIYGMLFFQADGITSIFNSENNQNLQAIAVRGLRLYFTASLFAGLNIVLCIYFTSTDRAKPANLVSMLRGFLLIIPMAFLLSGIWGITGLWLAFPVTEFLVALVGIGAYLWYYFQREKM